MKTALEIVSVVKSLIKSVNVSFKAYHHTGKYTYPSNVQVGLVIKVFWVFQLGL